MPTKVVTVYGQDGCSFCMRATAYLAQRGFTYEYKNLTQNPELQGEFIERTAGATTVPQIFVGDDKIGGYDDLVALPLSALQAKVGGA